MKPTQHSPRAGPESLARQHHARAARRAARSRATSTSCRSPGSPRTRRSSITRSRAARPMTPRSASGSRAGKSGEKLFFEIALEDITRPRICSARSTSAPPASMAGSRSKSRRSSPTTPRATLARGEGAARAGRPAQPVHQDSGHARRAARDRGGDLRGRSDQRDAAVLARAVRGGGRSLAARHRAPDRGGAESRRRLRRVDLRQPLGRRGRGQGAAGAHNTARHRDRQRSLPGLFAAAGILALAACIQRRRAPAAAPLGEHGHEGPQGVRHSVHQGARRAATVNTMPEATLKAFADHGEVGSELRADGGDCEKVLARVPQGRRRPRCARREAAGGRRRLLR